MLVECLDCSAQISTEALACPHCGRPRTVQSHAAPAPPAYGSDAIPSPPTHHIEAKQTSPAFLIAAGAGLVFSLFTPRIIVVLPILATVVLAIVSLVRREQMRALAIGVIVLAGGLFVISAMPSPGETPIDAAQYAQIADWNWHADVTFGEHGTVKWNVTVHNISNKPIRNAKVEFTTYDASGKLLASTFTYVDSIPPGGTRSDDSYADYFGNEASAKVQLTEVNFEQ